MHTTFRNTPFKYQCKGKRCVKIKLKKKTKNKKKTAHWRGDVSLRSRSGHPGVGSWGAETNLSLGGHPGVGAKSGGGGGGGREATPLLSVDDPERTRNETA